MNWDFLKGLCIERLSSMIYRSVFFIVLTTLFSSCYSFKGTSIPSNTNTFYVPNFQMETFDAPPELGFQIAEKLRLKVRNESRLKYNDLTPDIEFKGKVVSFVVSPVAPQNGGTPVANRLEISVSIDYLDHLDQKNNWTSSFSFFKDFDKNQTLSAVRDRLVDEIFDQLSEDIFNKAFSNW